MIIFYPSHDAKSKLFFSYFILKLRFSFFNEGGDAFARVVACDAQRLRGDYKDAKTKKQKDMRTALKIAVLAWRKLLSSENPCIPLRQGNRE